MEKKKLNNMTKDVQQAIEKVQGEIWARKQMKYLKYTIGLIIVYSIVIKILN